MMVGSGQGITGRALRFFPSWIRFDEQGEAAEVTWPAVNGFNVAADPMENFNDFSLSAGDGYSGILSLIGGLIGKIKVLGFALALTFSVILIIRYFITPNPMRREVMKSRTITIYVLVILLGAGLGIMDVFFEIASSVG